MYISRYNQVMQKRKELNLALSEIAKKEALISEKERRLHNKNFRKQAIYSLRLKKM